MALKFSADTFRSVFWPVWWSKVWFGLSTGVRGSVLCLFPNSALVLLEDLYCYRWWASSFSIEFEKTNDEMSSSVAATAFLPPNVTPRK